MESDPASSLLSIYQSEDTQVSRPTRSNVYDHCRDLKPQEPARDSQNRILYYCKYCDWAKISTTNFRSHLLKQHQISCQKDPSNCTNASIQQLLELYANLKVQQGTKPLDDELLKAAINKAAIKQCLIDLVVVRSLSLSIIEWPEFHAFCRALNPEIDSVTALPTSHNTITSWIEESFLQKKDLVRKSLQSARSRIHLSVDIWTTPNNHLAMAICGHFVNVDEQLQITLLALRHVTGHAGEVQFEEALLPVLEEYEIIQKIGAIIGDNAGTNDTLCRTISQYLREQFPRDPEWVASHQRIRCLGHIINLVVQAFLFINEKDFEELELYDQQDELGASSSEKGEGERATRGDKIRALLGPLGKLHNIVVHIRGSPQRTREFTDILMARRRIPLDNRTRWNSWYQMLDAIFDEEDTGRDLQITVSQYYQRHSDELEKDILDTREWQHLRTIYEYLSCFSSATLTAEGHCATLEQVLDNMDICSAYLQEQKVIYMISSFFI
jgi:hypothetical protein